MNPLELWLIELVNRAHARRAPDKPSPLPPVVPPEDVVLGHVLPSLPPPVPSNGARLVQNLVTLSPEARRRHVYVLGATGTGKTNLLLRLIESDIAAQRAFCVVDLRGDLIDRVLLRLAQTKNGPPEAMAERLVLLDLRQEEFSVGFNPLMGTGDAYSRAFHVLSVLRQQSDSWGIQLEETLRNALLALAETGGSLLDIDPLLSIGPFRHQTLARVQDGYVRNFFRRYDKLSEDKQMAWRLPVLNKVTPVLSVPPLRRLFGQREGVSFQKLLDDAPGRIILISLAVDRLHQAAYVAGSLLVSAFQTAIMARADRPEAERTPVHLYIDEFETMATEQFASIIAEGRRFGLGLCLCHQNLSQLSPALRHALRNNVHTQCYFQTGALDAQELAAEIVADGTREAVQQTLMGQGVGEAYLVRRGQSSLRVRVAHSPDPAADPGAVQSLRRASLLRHGRPQEEVERDLAGRAWQWEPAPATDVRRGTPARPPATKGGAAVSNAVEPESSGPVRPASEKEADKEDVSKDEAANTLGKEQHDSTSADYEVRRRTPRRFRPGDAE